MPEDNQLDGSPQPEQPQEVQEERVLGDGARGDVNDPAKREDTAETVQQEGQPTAVGGVPAEEPAPEAPAPAQPETVKSTKTKGGSQ